MPNRYCNACVYSYFKFKQIHYPSNPLQPGPIYFLTPRKCGIFGVCCAAIPQQVNFLIDEAFDKGKGANAVISMVHYYLENHVLHAVILTCNNDYFNTLVQNGKDKGTIKQVHFEEHLNDSVASSDAECPICGAIYGNEDDESIWICFDGCNLWFNIECTSLRYFQPNFIFTNR